MSRSESPPGPSSKRIKLEDDVEEDVFAEKDVDDDSDGDHCSICLQLLLDRTVIPECSHEFCFDCIVTWTEQSRRCPLCTRTIGPYLIHHIRSNFDYQKYHLPPLRSSPPPIQPLRRVRRSSIHRASVQERRWGRRERREQDVADELERAIDRRRWIYHNHLYAKHVASNTFTRFRPFPTPAQLSASQEYIRRATIFIRRELRVWPNLDVEFLTTFIISLMKAIDIRSESAVKLLAEFLDMDHPYCEGKRFPNAEHFAHELYSFLRSPYKSLSAYDANVQYDESGVYRRVHRDNKTAPDRRSIDEAISPHASRARRPSRERSHLHDGGDQFQSNIAVQDTNEILDHSSSGSPMSPSTGKRAIYNGSGAGAPLEEASANPSREAYGRRMSRGQPPDSHFTCSTEPATSHLQVNIKGKRTASTDKDLATDVSNGHCHVDQSHESPRDGKEVEGPQTFGNTSADTSGHVPLRETEDSARQSSYQNSRQSAGLIRTHLRTRNPLFLAQAHLSGSLDNQKAKQTHRPPAKMEDFPSDIRRPLQSSNERPSLLSRLGEPERPEVQFSEVGEGLSESCLEQEGKSVKLANDDLRAKLVQRLEMERAAQSELDLYASRAKEGSSSLARTPSNYFGDEDGESPGPVKEPRLANVEAGRRAQALLKMKLTVAKHLNSPTVRPGNFDDRAPEEKPKIAGNREGMLRVVLENRRRGG